MRNRLCIQTILFVLVIGTIQAQEFNAELEWIPLNNSKSMRYVSALEGSEHRLYVATAEGIFFSENDGNTWLSTAFDNVDKYVTTLTINENTVYAGTWQHGVFRSDDAGITWKPINDGLRFQGLDGEYFYGEVRRILIIGDTTVSVMYHGGTYTSTDRGETWKDISELWYAGNSIYSLTAFDGYLWGAMSIEWMARSPDNGQTWQPLANFQKGRVNDWAALHGRLYVAGQGGIGRWNETTHRWEYPTNGLPIGKPGYPNHPPFVSSLVVRGDHLFAGLHTHGVYVFDALSETWSVAGLQDLTVLSLVSHRGGIYVGTKENGIYHAEPHVLPAVSVQPRGKAVTTWARMKQDASQYD